MLATLRLALRSLARAPGFVAAAVGTLALGIGATTAIFSVVDAVLLRPLPYRDAGRLAAVWSHTTDPTIPGPPSYADFEDWRRGTTAPGAHVEGMAFARSESLLLRGAESAASINVAFVSEGFFPLLGGRPLLGRAFAVEEERPGAPRVIVLGHRLWQTRFGGDRRIVGRTLDFAGGSYTVVGVMPPGYEYPGRWAEAWAPLAPLAAETPAVRERLARRALRVDARVIARLRDGASLAAAQADLAAVARALTADHPAENRGWSAHLVSLREELVGGVRQPLLVLLGAVGLLLLVACADVANLSLVRALGRAREMAVRSALGAGQGRLARQLLTESALVALAGGALGALLAVGGVGALRRAAPTVASFSAAPTLDGVGIDGRVLAFALVASLGTALLFGIVPALHAARGASRGALRAVARGAGAAAAGRRLRDAVVVVQLALTLVLLVGAALLGRSFLKVRERTPGFPLERLVVLRVEPLASRYATPEQLVALWERLRAAAAAVPGARGAGVVNHLAMTGAGIPTAVRAPGAPDSLAALFRVADGGYFAAAGIPVLQGRPLGDADQPRAVGAGAADVPAVVSATLARQTWPRGDALGARFTVFRQASGRADYGAPVQAVVVGIADEVKVGSLAETVATPAVYLPMTANPWRWAYLVVRADGEPAALVGAVRRAVRAVDPDIPVADVTTGAAMLRDGLAARRFDLAVLATFAAAALTLAAVGVYGVVAHGVAQRVGELGVRAALGALPARLVGLVLRDVARVAGLGIVAGLVLALGASRVLAGLLFGVGAYDVASYAGIAALLASVAFAATVRPMRRAARVDPAVALRAE